MNRLLPVSLLAIVSLLAVSPRLPAEEFQKVVDRIELDDGDTFVFLGDSITHQCLYTQYVEDYFYTRYPQRRIHFHNSGVGGDRANDALTRFDEDVAAYRPKYVSILLGMNDGSYRDFDQATFDTYQSGMTTILEKINGLGATAIPMTPTMFDARAKRMRKDFAEPRNTYYNGVLAFYAAWLREQAAVHGLGFVDMYSPLNNLTIEQRKRDATFTMIPDGVHPGPAGQTVMAAAIIDDMVRPSPVSRIVIEERNGAFAAAKGKGTVRDLKGDAQGVSFTHQAESLPWVLPAEAADGVELTKLERRHGTERLIVRDLAPGKYELTIEGQPVGTFSNDRLAVGVDLQGNDKTPQFQQALAVANLNKRRNDEAYHPIRDQYGALKGQRRKLEEAETKNEPELEAKRAAFEEWYAGMKTKVEELKGKAKEFEDQIYATNQPKALHYELKKAS